MAQPFIWLKLDSIFFFRFIFSNINLIRLNQALHITKKSSERNDALELKGVLHPDTKISMFCLFSPSSGRKSILFMYGCDRCVWFKVKKHDIFFHGSTNLSCGTVQNIFFLFNLRNHFKINRINSCLYYSWNHPFSVKKYIPMLKSSFTWLDLAIWSWPPFTIGDSNAPEITQNMYFLNIG